ncbi:MAG: sugar phosphate isomerase/epimerase family protein [Planctomycetota bacterium]|jgi:sugar phosphate isomerase/epimerase
MESKPQLAMGTTFCPDVPLAEALPMIAAAGFTHVAVGANAEHYKPVLAEAGTAGLRRRIEDCGLLVDSIHCKGDLCESNNFRAARNRVDLAFELGARAMVLHSSPGKVADADVESCLEDALEACDRMYTFARDSGVNFSVENVAPGPGERLCEAVVSAVDPECFGFCFDSSNAWKGEPAVHGLLESLGGRLTVVHLSDRSSVEEAHQVPGEGKIDWEGLCAALRASAFELPLTIEAGTRSSKWKDPAEFLREAAAAGRNLWTRLRA